MGVQIPPPLPGIGARLEKGWDAWSAEAQASDMNEELTLGKSPMTRIRDYFEGIRVEMRRVTWPSKQEIYGTTMMVILTTFLFGIYFWICDEAFSNMVAKALKFFLHGR